MTIKKRVFVAIMERKLKLGLGLTWGLELGLGGYESGYFITLSFLLFICLFLFTYLYLLTEGSEKS